MSATNTVLNAGETASPVTACDGTLVNSVTFNLFTPYVEVISDGAATMAVTVDGSTPAVGGPKSIHFPASASVRTIRLGPSLGRNPVVKLISAGTPSYVVSAIPSPLDG